VAPNSTAELAAARAQARRFAPAPGRVGCGASGCRCAHAHRQSSVRPPRPGPSRKERCSPSRSAGAPAAASSPSGCSAPGLTSSARAASARAMNRRRLSRADRHARAGLLLGAVPSGAVLSLCLPRSIVATSVRLSWTHGRPVCPRGGRAGADVRPHRPPLDRRRQTHRHQHRGRLDGRRVRPDRVPGRPSDEAPHLAALVRDLQRQNLELAGLVGSLQQRLVFAEERIRGFTWAYSSRSCSCGCIAHPF
jgi:hypothetical protein